MNRRELVVLLMVSLLLVGCLWVKPDNGLTTIEVKGELAGTQELLLTGESCSYLVDLGQQEVVVLALEAGTWMLEAFSRNAAGHVVSVSKPIPVRGKRQTVVSPKLVATSAKTAEVRAQDLVHTWLLAGGVELAWDVLLTSAEQGRWEVWKRHGDSPFWRKIGDQALQGSFVDPDIRAYEHYYAVRYLPPQGDALVFASPLQASQGPRPGFLEVVWDFEHNFPYPSMLSQLVLADPTGGLHLELGFTDLVAHFRTEDDFARRSELLASLGLSMKREIPGILAVVVEPIPGSRYSLEEWSIYGDKHLFLEPNWIVQGGSLGTQMFDLPWYLEYIRIPGAHEVTRGNAGVRIAILDSGLNTGQLPTSVNVLPGYNIVNKNYDTRDDYEGTYHGTNIALTIAAAIPVVSLQPVKVLRSTGYGTEADVSEGILYAAGLHDKVVNPTPAHIINLSLGQAEESTVMRRAIERVSRETDVLVIAASGNTREGAIRPGVYYPAAFAQVIAVGAIAPGPDGPRRASYSHYGPDLDLVAPPSFKEGTSFSTALVSGVAGLMHAQGIPLAEIRPLLAATAMDLGITGWDEEYGYGLVHGEWAVKEIAEISLKVIDVNDQSVQIQAPLQGEPRYFYLAPGEYSIEAWVNIQGGSEPGLGDYLGFSGDLIVLEEAKTKVSLTLREED